MLNRPDENFRVESVTGHDLCHSEWDGQTKIFVLCVTGSDWSQFVSW